MRCISRLRQTLRWPHRRTDGPRAPHVMTSFTIRREMNTSPCPLCLGSSPGSWVDWEPQGTWSASQINIMELIDQLKFSRGTVLECTHSFSVCYSLRSKITSLHSSLHTWIRALGSHQIVMTAPFVSFCCLFFVQLSYCCWGQWKPTANGQLAPVRDMTVDETFLFFFSLKFLLSFHKDIKRAAHQHQHKKYSICFNEAFV